jgi:hypothetical protein
MKELLSRFLLRKLRDTSERSRPPSNQTLLADQLDELNPRDAFRLRVSNLRDEAKARHMQGGDAEMEQTMMELVAMAMTMKREDHALQREEIAVAIGLSSQDYLLAEAAILEPEKLFDALPSWFVLFGYDEGNFMADLEAKAHLAIAHRRNMSPDE